MVSPIIERVTHSSYADASFWGQTLYEIKSAAPEPSGSVFAGERIVSKGPDVQSKRLERDARKVFHLMCEMFYLWLLGIHVSVLLSLQKESSSVHFHEKILLDKGCRSPWCSTARLFTPQCMRCWLPLLVPRQEHFAVPLLGCCIYSYLP